MKEANVTIASSASATTYRHKRGGLGKRVAFFGGTAAVLIVFGLIGLLVGGGSATMEAVPALILGFVLLGALLIVVRAERRGRPCLVLEDGHFTYLGYLKTKRAKWSDLGVFTVYVRTPATSDDSSNANVEPTRTLQAWLATGTSARPRGRKPDFVIEDYFDLPLDDLKVILNRRIEAARDGRAASA